MADVMGQAKRRREAAVGQATTWTPAVLTNPAVIAAVRALLAKGVLVSR